VKPRLQAALLAFVLLLIFVAVGSVLYRTYGAKVFHYQTLGQRREDFLGAWQCARPALDISVTLGEPRGLRVHGLALGKDIAFDRFDAKAPYVEEKAAGTPRQLYFRGKRLVLQTLGEDGKSAELFFDLREPGV
jgi:hypothetical protein